MTPRGFAGRAAAERFGCSGGGRWFGVSHAPIVSCRPLLARLANGHRYSRHMTPAQQELFDAARAIQQRAHAPYSHYKVGAALRTASGAIYSGCNVENAAYPQGCCAEASAISAMVGAGEHQIVEVLVIADGDRLASCCGGCRQRIREFAALDTPIHTCGPDGIRLTLTLDQLLPYSFGPDNLEGFVS